MILQARLGPSPSRAPPPPRRRRGNTAASSARREPKDPSKYADVEELRRELEASTGAAPFSITRAVQWLARAANRPNGGGSLALALAAGRPPAGAPAARWRLPPDSSSPRRAAAAAAPDAPALAAVEARLGEPRLRALEAALLAPRSEVLRLALRCPALEALPPAEVCARLVELKSLFPAADAARMLALVPSAFLGPDAAAWAAARVRAAAAGAALRAGLPGADVDALAEADPALMFEEPAALAAGLARLRELWPAAVVGPRALAASDPAELALAVRALIPPGPPRAM
jgi:hypothetical protein